MSKITFYQKYLNLIIFSLLLFFLFVLPSSVSASKKDELTNKLNEIKVYKKEINKTLTHEKEIDQAKKRKIDKQSIEDLKKNQIVPDLIISIDSTKVKEEEINKLVNKLQSLSNSGKKIDYFIDDKLVGVYIYLYNTEDKYQELKNELISDSIKISPNRKLVKQYTPNDSYYSSQWNLTNINWSGAMDIGAGTNQVVIGIIDNGVDVDDLELNSNIWQNSGEVYGDLNDNDVNGYIDDKYGCNFYMYWNQGFNYIACEKDNIKEELSFDTKHGTYVAQVAAANTNNNLGIAGVCPNCKIAVLKISDDFGNGYFDLLPYVFNYAIDKGFKILNLSYISSCPFDSSEDIYASDINLLINTYGINLVQSAGNQGAMTESECIATCGSSNPYCYSSARNQAYYYVEGKNVANKINVASINSSNQRSSFSVYDGSSSVITIAAPGENIPIYANSTLNYINGTSFSAPMVSGALGFYLSHNLNFTNSSWSLKYLLNNLGDNISTDYYISNKKLNLNNMVNIRRRFIENLYSKLLERTFDNSGLSSWLNYFNSNLNKISIINGFINSDEYLNKYLTNVYQKFLKRNPDSLGLNAWKNYIRNNGDYDHLFYYLVISQEYKNKYPTNESYVENLYKDILDRNYDIDGYNYWIDQLNRNLKTKDQVSYEFVFSYESNYKFVKSLYTKYLSRVPSDGEINLWINNQNLNRIYILRSVINSEEFFVR